MIIPIFIEETKTTFQEQAVISLPVTAESLDATWPFIEQLKLWFLHHTHQNFLDAFKKWRFLALSPQLSTSVSVRLQLGSSSFGHGLKALS